MASDGTTRAEKFPIGIASVGLGEVERQMPVDEPPPLPPNAELCGDRQGDAAAERPRQGHRRNPLHRRRRAARHAARPNPALAARRTREVRSIDSPRRRAPSRRPRRPARSSRPERSRRRAMVRYVGAPVVAVAAVPSPAAEEALRLIRVDYKSLPFVVDMDKAREPRAPVGPRRRFGAPGPSLGLPAPAGLPLNGNVRGPGDRESRRRRARLRASRCRRRGRVSHPGADPLLPGAARHRRRLARRRPDGLYVDPVHRRRARTSWRRRSACRSNRVRVIVDGMGGGFGSKSTLGNYGRIAVALSRQARRAGAPRSRPRTKSRWTPATGPETWQRLRIGARRDGSLTAISL